MQYRKFNQFLVNFLTAFLTLVALAGCTDSIDYARDTKLHGDPLPPVTLLPPRLDGSSIAGSPVNSTSASYTLNKVAAGGSYRKSTATSASFKLVGGIYGP